MIFLDDKRKDLSTGFVENNPATEPHLPDATRNKILNSTVRLFAPSYDSSNQNYPDMYGSGVIFNVQGNAVQVLTALHNVLVWKNLKTPPDDPSKLLSDFGEKLKVFYGNGNMSFNAQAAGNKCEKNTVTIPDVEVCYECVSKLQPKSPCYYDLALISCEKSEFVTYANNFVLGADYKFDAKVAGLITGVEAVFKKKYACVQLGYGDREEKRPKLIFNKDQNKMEQVFQVIPLSPKAPAGTEPTKIQVFEKRVSAPTSQNMTKYNLHYRVAKFENLETHCMFNQEATGKGGDQTPAYVAYPHAYVLTTNGGTSAPGDSGGPVYIIDVADLTKVYLLGVTTGSDMEASEVPPTKRFYNDIVTSVLPYFETLKPADEDNEDQ
jgi:hypothetical protein